MDNYFDYVSDDILRYVLPQFLCESKDLQAFLPDRNVATIIYTTSIFANTYINYFKKDIHSLILINNVNDYEDYNIFNTKLDELLTNEFLKHLEVLYVYALCIDIVKISIKTLTDLAIEVCEKDNVLDISECSNLKKLTTISKLCYFKLPKSLKELTTSIYNINNFNIPENMIINCDLSPNIIDFNASPDTDYHFPHQIETCVIKNQRVSVEFINSLRNAKNISLINMNIVSNVNQYKIYYYYGSFIELTTFLANINSILPKQFMPRYNAIEDGPYDNYIYSYFSSDDIKAGSVYIDFEVGLPDYPECFSLQYSIAKKSIITKICIANGNFCDEKYLYQYDNLIELNMNAIKNVLDINKCRNLKILKIRKFDGTKQKLYISKNLEKLQLPLTKQNIKIIHKLSSAYPNLLMWLEYDNDNTLFDKLKLNFETLIISDKDMSLNVLKQIKKFKNIELRSCYVNLDKTLTNGRDLELEKYIFICNWYGKFEDIIEAIMNL
jgi:hypothetical protein